MLRITSIVVFGAAALVTTSVTHAALIVDNFESYTPPNAIATSATSTPWLRFGSIGDNMYATSAAGKLLDGSVSADIPIALTSATASATIRKNYVTAINLTSYGTATVLTKSSSTTPSTAALQLSIADATTTYISTIPLAETDAVETLTFSLAPAALTLAGGTDSLATVLAGVTSIGFRLGNYGTATSTNETLDFDDFVLQSSAIPEPTSFALVAISSIGLLSRRRKA